MLKLKLGPPSTGRDHNTVRFNVFTFYGPGRYGTLKIAIEIPCQLDEVLLPKSRKIKFVFLRPFRITMTLDWSFESLKSNGGLCTEILIDLPSQLECSRHYTFIAIC